MTNYKVFHFNLLRTACTVLWGNDLHCAIFDPGISTDEEWRELEQFILREKLRPAAVLLTHGHPDHISGAASVSRRFGIPVWMSPVEKAYLPIFRQYGADIGLPVDIGFHAQDAVEGTDIPVGEELRLKVIETPGHSAGGVCYYDAEGKILVAGDTLFAGAIGRSDLHGGDYDVLIRSILEKLMPLPADTLVIPGHGMMTTIGAEAGSNPFLEPFNEPLQEESD